MDDKINIDVYVSTHGDGKATVANVEVIIGKWGRLYYAKKFSASAVRHPEDPYAEHVGVLLSVGRALELAGRRLQAVADGAIKQEIRRRDSKRKRIPIPVGISRRK